MTEQLQTGPICVLVLSDDANPDLQEVIRAVRGNVALFCTDLTHAMEAANREFVPDIVVVMNQDSGTVARLRARYSQKNPRFVWIGSDGQWHSGLNFATPLPQPVTVEELTELFEQIRKKAAGTSPEFQGPATDTSSMAS